jgi:hypothetical protein
MTGCPGKACAPTSLIQLNNNFTRIRHNGGMALRDLLLLVLLILCAGVLIALAIWGRTDEA